VSLFKINENKLFISDEEIFLLPEEFHKYRPIKIYATATCGLISYKGALVAINKALLQDGRTVSGKTFGEIEIGMAIHVREHIDIWDNPSFVFSRKPLTNQLNYITIEYSHFKLRIDPFSKEHNAIYT